MRTAYRHESEMYPQVASWLATFLRTKYPQSSVETLPTPTKRLNRLIAHRNLKRSLPPDWQSWEVKVDVVGFVVSESTTEIALVECKLSQITVAHLSQAIGYSRIVRPRWSFLLSPQGISPALRRLFDSYNREDILVYFEQPHHQPRNLILARWDALSQQIDNATLIPQGVL